MNLLLIFFLIVNASHLICVVLSVNENQLEKISPTFDEIYGKGWDEDGHEKIEVETSPLNSGENAVNEQADHDDNIDQDVEAYNSDSTDQNLTQEDPDSTDQNLTQEDPDCIDQNDDETFEGINDGTNEFSEQQKREIICKFHALKEEYKKKKGKVTKKEGVKIEEKIGAKLGVYRNKIYKWKKEFGLSRKQERNLKSFYEKKKCAFITKIEEIKTRQPREQNELIKDLGISRDTFINWKKEFGLPVNSKIIYSDSEKLQLMRKYYKIKRTNPKLNVNDIANMLNIGKATLYRWKKQFDPTLKKNSVDKHSLPENLKSFVDNNTFEHPMASSDDNVWAWNLTTQKRTERVEVDTL